MREKLSKLSEIIIKCIIGFASLVEVSVLLIVCSLPLFTLTASISSAYTAITDGIRRENDSVFLCFFRSYTSHIKKYWKEGLIVLFLVAVSLAGTVATEYCAVSASVFVKVLARILLMISLVLGLWVSLVTTKRIRKTADVFAFAFYDMIRFFPVTAFAVAGGMIAAYVCLVNWPGLAIVPGIYLWVISFMAEKALCLIPERGGESEETKDE